MLKIRKVWRHIDKSENQKFLLAYYFKEKSQCETDTDKWIIKSKKYKSLNISDIQNDTNENMYLTKTPNKIEKDEMD
jgi:hypothetical protein